MIDNSLRRGPSNSVRSCGSFRSPIVVVVKHFFSHATENPPGMMCLFALRIVVPTLRGTQSPSKINAASTWRLIERETRGAGRDMCHMRDTLSAESNKRWDQSVYTRPGDSSFVLSEIELPSSPVYTIAMHTESARPRHNAVPPLALPSVPLYSLFLSSLSLSLPLSISLVRSHSLPASTVRSHSPQRDYGN